MIINSFIGLINSIIAENKYLIGVNPLLYRTKTTNPTTVVTKKSKKRKENEMEINQEILVIHDLDWKKIIWNKKFKHITLNRIVSFYFSSIDNDHVGLTMTQEYTIDHHKQLIITHLKINIKHYLLMAINDHPVLNIAEGFDHYMNQTVNVTNLNIITTVLSILSSMACNKKNILMIKNIKSDLYTDLINYYQLNGPIVNIKSLNLTPTVDNIIRIKIEIDVEQDKVMKTLEEFFDFDCPVFSLPELILIHKR
jgi:hypothetical protein